ncbi:MAG: tRNA (adenosine(37)-N6)-threonylcarbamoyltransferase complex ATPase subunit type 1 TsaE [Candidatus Nealsonbacteria bacterium RIFCSPHIGHO2_01_FULL_38_55]|uniref:tRNA threonylcarbamoyladenosine biosynthesis protein TsaE n=2 Tax=Candidatus Nealsoniibacteriota TaxID=1817911 RepID=A0A1G2EHT4_9BACT|nr:MAG: hypothetical protein US88_C0026G0006 [Parcubacteria group bacterium GW2011_GWA2_38_27]KKQ96311.1 MAG: hypothetical protein UT22_C0034G0002 [Parcubacteria group bacterium GW2011_GWC2_39_11]OGZ19194.1 MAG: tRNA (adenosine(37)-N6)-threonylcarbamoyltransferase complex ATPase subunit type 1 TsaE [Candidatus Nealsonbacteria bacterium RIFCSPHIGHO2_01_FULL_38_55]OGZ21229.1 MAG: tRNA (adenosine(37)-N6)-threonylcarbamoyltransferase complex ATPase subunit type 1 TsaE [Candidatus Nealsonbacteria bac
METKYITNNPNQTKKLGEKFAKEILELKQRKTVVNQPRSCFLDGAFVIGLKGELGGGKTCFLQGFAKGLGVKEKILSPTFVVYKKFHVPCSMFHDFYHFDCYRIKDSKEISDLGFKEIISNPENIVAIEWSEKIKEVLPKNIKWISFYFIDKNSRAIDIF